MLKKQGGTAVESVPKKGRRIGNRALIVLSVAALSLVVALPACAPSGTSGGNANEAGTDWDAVIASNPADPFVASYESASNDCMAMHKNLGYTCEDCHDDADAQLVGSFDEAPDSSELNVGTREMCLSCHDWDKIVDGTILVGEKTVYDPEGTYNVHDNHRGDVNCSECHSMHETSTLHCVECHYLELPEGWDGYE